MRQENLQNASSQQNVIFAKQTKKQKPKGTQAGLDDTWSK